MKEMQPLRVPRMRSVLPILLQAATIGLLAAAAAAAFAQAPADKDTFEATTSGMKPDGVRLQIDVLEWSDADAREAVIAALALDSGVSEALGELPTAGVVWRDGSAVGHAIKYAHRQRNDDGTQRVTVVTEKPIDAYSFETWSVDGRTTETERPYTVIELMLDADGRGTGNLSLSAAPIIDADEQLISLDTQDGEPVLADARLKPKPYWAGTE